MRPDAVLEPDAGRAREGRGRLSLDLIICRENADGHFAVRVKPVALAVSRPERRADSCDLVCLDELPGLFEVVHQGLALRIDIGRDVMRDLSRDPAEADAPVECGGAQPEGFSVEAISVRAPEAGVVPLPGAFSNRSFKSEVLFAAKKIEVADRRF